MDSSVIGARAAKTAFSCVLTILLFVPAFMGSMQQREIASRPAFEVATIKPTRGGNGVGGGCRGVDTKLGANDVRVTVPLGRCVITAGRLSHLMSIAFGLPIQRISGVPDWDGPLRFDLEAKAEDPSTATEQELLSMLQLFLTAQFKLEVRRETKEAPMFSLVVAKNGPKNLRPSEEPAGSMTPKGSGLVFRGYSMANLAAFLSVMPSVARPVKDTTSIEGRFDFTLDILEAKTEDVAELKMALSRWDSIFNDIQQLGLRLEPTKGPVENLIIVHAEKPVAN
jgi:uncharacterized protein (TIGR03435 family)